MSIGMMDFRKLSAFCKVYEKRSFSRAGEELFLSQPTISAHILGLEEELGVRLFDRLGRTVLPTPPAELLYKAASEVFRRLEHVRSEIEMLQDTVSGTLLIGASTIPGHWIVPDMLAEFGAQNPQVTFSLSISGSAEIMLGVHEGAYELGFVGAEPERPGFEYDAILEDEIIAVVSPKVRARLIDPDKPISQWPWIMREPNCGTRLAFERALDRGKRRVADFRTVAHVESTHAVLAAVRAGLGVGVISRIAVKDELESEDLVQVDLGIPPIMRSIYMIRKKGRELFPATTSFIRFVQSPTSS